MTLEEIKKLPISELVPHRPPMILLDRVIDCDGESLEAELTLTAHSPFCVDGKVGAWIGIEYMAQAVAALAGAQARLVGKEPRIGLLLGTREYQAQVPSFAQGSVLRVKATKEIFDPQGLSVVECSIRDQRTDALLARAALTAVEVEDFQAFLREHRS